MNSRTVGIIGVVILLIGLFVPLSRGFEADTATTIDFPALTQFGFLMHGDPQVIAYVILVLAALGLSFTRFNRALIVLGVIVLALVYYDHSLMQLKMEAESRMVATSPENAMLIARTGAEAWGWYFLAFGGLVLTVAGILKPRSSVSTENSITDQED